MYSKKHIYLRLWSLCCKIIDDLGAEPAEFIQLYPSLFICLTWTYILRQKSTIISTNLALDDIKTIYSETDIFTHSASNYTILRITGDDFIRIQKKFIKPGKVLMMYYTVTIVYLW